MPLYFFHLRTGEHLDRDTVGVDLRDLDDARFEALGAIADMLRDAALIGQAVQGEAFEITDQEGQPILTLRLDALLGCRHVG
jgi:hypothetical protein